MSDFLFPMDEAKDKPLQSKAESPTFKGCISETLLKLECLKRGITPFEPSHPNTKADLILINEKGTKISVQVKRATFCKSAGGWLVPTCTKIARNKPVRRYVHGDFDVLAAHIPDGDVFCFWPVDFIGGRTGVVWKNGSSPRDNWEDIEAA